MQNVAWPITMVQMLNGMSIRPREERSAMPVTMRGRAGGSTTRNDTASRPKKRLLATASAAMVPNTRASTVAPTATCSESDSAFHRSARVVASANQRAVSPGSGKLNVCSSVVKAYIKITTNGRFRNSRPANAARLSGHGARTRPAPAARVPAAAVLERIERPQFARQGQVNRHDGDGHDGESRGQRHVARAAPVDLNGPAKD